MGHQTQFHKFGEIETAKGAYNANVLNFFGTQSRMKLDEIKSYKPQKKLTGWTIFPFGDREWILKQVKMLKKIIVIQLSYALMPT